MLCTTMTPAEFATYLKTARVVYTYYQTAAGLVRVLATDMGIFEAIFVKCEQELPGYTRSDALDSTQFIVVGTEFQCAVWKALLCIPVGSTVSYAQIAAVIGKPTAFRAVANAVGDNKIAYFIPCHRVIRTSGDMCGYNWGVERKRKLLEAEGAI